MPSAFVVILALVPLVILLGLYSLLRTSTERARIFKNALENNQKRLEQVMSQLNILTGALPNLQTHLLGKSSGENWVFIALEETRALLRADGGSYWRFHEKNQALECDLARGALETFREKQNWPRAILDNVIQSAKTRLPVLGHEGQSARSSRSYLSVPLSVQGQVWGVFHFLRQGEDLFGQRDSDLGTTFVRQVALTLENRDMTKNREKYYLEFLQTLADMLDARDASTKGQTRRARQYARGIAHQLDLPDDFIYYLEFAALLHDIGKIGIDEALLRKPGKLTSQEFEILKKHPEMGHRIVAPVAALAPVAPMVLYHQEWFNGNGYPEGLSGEEIPLGARIVAVLDAWIAMTSDRPWRSALSASEAIHEIKKGAGTQFDPKVVDAFLTTLEKQGAGV